MEWNLSGTWNINPRNAEDTILKVAATLFRRSKLLIMAAMTAMAGMTGVVIARSHDRDQA